MLVRTTIAVAAVALASVAIAFAADSPKIKPPKSLGTKCGVFPRPGTDVAADAPSLDDQRAWNQDVSQAPLDPRSDAIISGLGGDLHPDFGSPRAVRHPLQGRR